MGLIKCPGCGCTISDLLDVCPGCGYRPEGRNFYPGKPGSTAIPIRCPWCGEMVPAGMKNCPNCGSPAKVSYATAPDRLEPVELDYKPMFPVKQIHAEKRRSSWLFILITVLFAALLIYGIIRIDTTVRKNRAPISPEPNAQIVDTDDVEGQEAS